MIDSPVPETWEVVAMTSKHGLFRSDGRPARQYGEEIIEPGQEFNEETLDVIRSLVDEKHDATEALSGLESDHAPDAEWDAPKVSDVDPEPPEDLSGIELRDDEPQPALKPLLHFSEPQEEAPLSPPTDWVSKAHQDAQGGARRRLLWRVDTYARGVAVVFLAVVAVWAF